MLKLKLLSSPCDNANKERSICIPKGNPNKTLSGFYEDSTRLPAFYDGTYNYLKSLGIEEI